MENCSKLNMVFKDAFDKIRKGELKTLIPFLMLFRLNGKPMNLKMHYQFAPLFNTVQAANTVYMCGRQLGKSYSVCSSSLLRSMLVPFYHSVIIQPRADQIQRLNSTVYRPLMNSCPMSGQFISSFELSKMALKEFNSGSLSYMEHMFSNADRLRGISGAAATIVDECLSAETEIYSFDSSLKKIKIKEISGKNVLLSFDISKNRCILSPVVNKASYRGVRPCFKVITASGREVTCTEGHKFPTPVGKMRLEEIIEHEHRKRSCQYRDVGTSGECGNGEYTGGCVYNTVRDADKGATLESQCEAKTVCGTQVPDITRVRHESTVRQTESRIRGYLDSFDPEVPWSISLYVFTPETGGLGEENSDSRISGSDNAPDSTGMVVHGRRESSEGAEYSKYSDERVQLYRKHKPAGMAGCGVGDNNEHTQRDTCREAGGELFSISSAGGLSSSGRVDRAIHSGMYEIQNGHSHVGVPFVRIEDCYGCSQVLQSSMRGGVQENSKEAVQGEKHRAYEGEIQRMESCPQGGSEQSCKGKVCKDVSGKETGTECICEGMADTAQNGDPGEEKGCQRRNQELSGIQSKEICRGEGVLRETETGSGEIRKQTATSERIQKERGQKSPRLGISEEVQRRASGYSCSTTGTLKCASQRESSCAERSGRGGVRGIQSHRQSQEPRHDGEDKGRSCASRGVQKTCQGKSGCGQGQTHCEIPREEGCRVEAEEAHKRAAGQSYAACERQGCCHVSGGAGSVGRETQAVQTEVCAEKEAGGRATTDGGVRTCTDGAVLNTPINGRFVEDRIASIEYAGELPVYDIEVIGTHSYILGNGLCSYNCQDIEYELLDIANETMSASLFWGFSIYTGTPKTTDTTLALLWDRSSKAEWVIRCTHCNYFNVPNPEHDLLNMLGDHGPICAKCGKPIYPQNGGYVHAIPDKARYFPGYHVSQTIHPLHMFSQAKWSKLLNKVKEYDTLTLYNEVLGWPYDASTSPLTLSDMLKATHDIPELKSPSDIAEVADQYRYITVGVDWSGGGMISDSYTAYAVLGLRASSDVIDVLYGRRIPKGQSPTDEANEILSWIAGTGADAFAYDNGGAGFARLEIMNHLGLRNIPNLTIVPINYVRPHSGDVMQPHTGQRESDLYYYTLDKSRSLAISTMSIKSCRIRFPKFPETDDKHYVRDWLALREDPRKSLGNETVILIIKKPGVPDDFAHAVNFGCSQIWDHFGAYPRIGSRYDASILDFDENNNKIMPDDVFGPRGDWERFQNAVEMRASVIEPEDLVY